LARSTRFTCVNHYANPFLTHFKDKDGLSQDGHGVPLAHPPPETGSFFHSPKVLPRKLISIPFSYSVSLLKGCRFFLNFFLKVSRPGPHGEHSFTLLTFSRSQTPHPPAHPPALWRFVLSAGTFLYETTPSLPFPSPWANPPSHPRPQPPPVPAPLTVAVFSSPLYRVHRFEPNQ